MAFVVGQRVWFRCPQRKEGASGIVTRVQGDRIEVRDTPMLCCAEPHWWLAAELIARPWWEDGC